MRQPFAVQAFDPGALGRFQARAREAWGLSPRQAEAAFHLCRGLTHHGALGRAMGISAGTRKELCYRCYQRLGVACAAAAVMRVWRLFDEAHRARREPAGAGGEEAD